MLWSALSSTIIGVDTWQLIGAISTDYLSWLQTEKRPSVKEKKKAQAETVPDSEKPFACARKFSK